MHVAGTYESRTLRLSTQKMQTSRRVARSAGAQSQTRITATLEASGRVDVDTAGFYTSIYSKHCLILHMYNTTSIYLASSFLKLP